MVYLNTITVTISQQPNHSCCHCCHHHDPWWKSLMATLRKYFSRQHHPHYHHITWLPWFSWPSPSPQCPPGVVWEQCNGGWSCSSCGSAGKVDCCCQVWCHVISSFILLLLSSQWQKNVSWLIANFQVWPPRQLVGQIHCQCEAPWKEVDTQSTDNIRPTGRR